MGALISRRSLILSGVAVGLAVTAGGLATLWPAAAGYRVLSEREVWIVEAIARVLFPPGVFPVHGGDGGTAPEVDRLLAETIDPAAVPPFRYLLRAIQLGTLLSRGTHFSDLPRDEAQSVLEVWSSEDPFPRRLATDSFKVLVGMGFFCRAEVLDAIGWRLGCEVRR